MTVTTNPTLQTRIAVMSRGDDDARQEMYLALVEREAKDPRFASQQVGYHIRAAHFAAWHHREKAIIYDKYVSGEPVITDGNGDEVSIFDTMIVFDDEQSVESQVEAREAAHELRAAIETLPAHQARIARLLLAGYAPSEIAYKLGVSRANISQISRRMLAALRERL